MARNDRESFSTRLYTGELSYRFIALRRRWYAGSLVVIVVGLISLGIRGLNPSIDFKGGAQFQGPLNGHSVSQIASAFSAVGITPEVSQTTHSIGSTQFQIETKNVTQIGTDNQVQQIQDSLQSRIGIPPQDVTITTVGSTWGSQITNKAILGLVIFLIAVVIYLSLRFEWKMALAAFTALIHDLLVTVGIYSLSGLQVSPSTVIAVLTILGYSLYDTVVVFDKVRENTNGITNRNTLTYSEAANLAVNQTLVRSINTSVIALLPVIGLLVIGAGVLGAGSLDQLAVALLVGLLSGAYSSIFIATPLLCELKEREPAYQSLARRISTRAGRSASRAATPAFAGAGANSGVAVTHTGDSDPAAGTTPAGSDGRGGAASDRLERPHRQNRTTTRPGGRGSRSRRRR